jgi:pyridoxamine 5'-phosphate oxidase family protein
MSVFSAAEIDYLQSQRLGRLATSGPDGQPHVVPVAFRYNPEQDTIDIGGDGFARRKKYRDVQHNPRVAFVVDDLASIRPWRPRMIEIRGVAEIIHRRRGILSYYGRRRCRSQAKPAARGPKGAAPGLPRLLPLGDHPQDRRPHRI